MSATENEKGQLTGQGIKEVVKRLVPTPSAEDFALREMVHGFAPGSIRDFSARMTEEMPDEVTRGQSFALGFILGLTIGHAQGESDAQ